MVLNTIYKKNFYLGGAAAKAQWIHLRLPFCGPEFESQSQHRRFIQFVIVLWCERDKNKQKQSSIGPYKKHLFFHSIW